MSAIVQASRPAFLNRRRRVRQKVHAPAYASFGGASKSGMLDLYEVLDISEVGVAVQCASPMETAQQVELCLDLADSGGQISTTARVIWSDLTGRAGLALPALSDSTLHRLREWLFLNAIAAAANAAASKAPQSAAPKHSILRPNYTDTLTAASAVQREAESLGADLEAVLTLIASRSQSLLRASGAAIALVGKDAGSMICRASAGQSAPPVGATLQVGSGFSGECVRTGRMLRCDDAEIDERVDRLSCRALGIRSMLAAPVRMGERVVGLLEVFSERPGAFGENDTAVLQRFAETILAAVNRAARAHDVSPPPPTAPKPFTPPPGSVLFAHEPEESAEKKDAARDDDKVGGIRLPRAHLYLLITCLAAIFLALGYISAPSIHPWIQAKLQARERNSVPTVLASSQPPQSTTPIPAGPAIETATVDQLKQLADKGDADAQNALGLRYASGDGVSQDEREAVSWFTKAAENGNVKAQVALGTRYWAGRGVEPSLREAYFWTVLARAAGDKNSKTFAELLASRMSRADAAAIEQRADQWFQQRESRAKAEPAR
jgi:putative methionine-R-sulfoxide reductase with GAF domain